MTQVINLVSQGPGTEVTLPDVYDVMYFEQYVFPTFTNYACLVVQQKQFLLLRPITNIWQSTVDTQIATTQPFHGCSLQQ
jgi:hypothetical protein